VSAQATQLRAGAHAARARRFGALPERASERIRQADTPTIERWIEQVLTARTIGDVFA
jgi:predicted secreted protein